MTKEQEKILKGEWFKMKAISDVSQIMAKFMQDISDLDIPGPQGHPDFMCQEVLIQNIEHFSGFVARNFDGDIEDFEIIYSEIIEGLEDRLIGFALAEKTKTDLAMTKGPNNLVHLKMNRMLMNAQRNSINREVVITAEEAKQAKRIFVLQSNIKAEINPKITEAKFAELLPKENKITSDEAKQALKERL